MVATPPAGPPDQRRRGRRLKLQEDGEDFMARLRRRGTLVQGRKEGKQMARVGVRG